MLSFYGRKMANLDMDFRGIGTARGCAATQKLSGARGNRVAVVLFLWSLSPGLAHAQVGLSTEAPPSAPRAPVSATSPVAKAAGQPVHMFFLARATSGDKRLVNNLTQADCTLTVDGRPQVLRTFSAQTKAPLTVGLLLDTNLHQQRVLPMEQQAATAFLQSALRPQDEAFVLSFDVTVDLLADLTASRKNLKDALERAQINASSGNFANATLPVIGRPRGALLYDAVFLATHEELQRQPGRRVLILLTEGKDDGSREKLRQAIAAAQKAHTIVYVLFVSDPGLYGILDETGSGAMRKLAKSTGGRFFHIGKDGRKLHAAFVEIEKELHAQYRASFLLSNAGDTAAAHPLDLTCAQRGTKLRVQVQRTWYPSAAR
ncbi:MAG: VWA domain-containing protein [Acidobacteriaceae bacterium]